MTGETRTLRLDLTKFVALMQGLSSDLVRVEGKKLPFDCRLVRSSVRGPHVYMELHSEHWTAEMVEFSDEPGKLYLDPPTFTTYKDRSRTLFELPRAFVLPGMKGRGP